jgi:gp16 family phage-associated protein
VFVYNTNTPSKTNRKGGKMENKKILTAAEALDKLDKAGLSVAAWARRHQVDVMAAYDVLAGRSVGKFGERHRVAVLLGMKEGTIEETGGRV